MMMVMMGLLKTLKTGETYLNIFRKGPGGDFGVGIDSLL